MPVGMQEIVCPPDFLIAQMTHAGVDHAILQAGGGYGAMNDYNAFAQNQHPGKFTGLLHIDEALADRDEVLVESTALIGSASRVSTTRRIFRATATSATSITPRSRRSGRRSSACCRCSLSFRRRRATTRRLPETSSRGRLLKRHPAHPFVCVMGPPAGYFARAGNGKIRRRRSRCIAATISSSK
jgi:hypothetical protein